MLWNFIVEANRKIGNIEVQTQDTYEIETKQNHLTHNYWDHIYTICT